MGNLFSSCKGETAKSTNQQTVKESQSKKKVVVSDNERQRVKLQNAIAKIDQSHERIKENIRKIEVQIQQATSARNMEKAKLLFKNKKIYDQQSKNIDSKRLLIIQAISNLDQAMTDEEVIKTINSTNEMIRKIEEQTNVLSLQNALEDLQDMEQAQNEQNQMYEEYINNNQVNEEFERLYGNQNNSNQQFNNNIQQGYVEVQQNRNFNMGNYQQIEPQVQQPREKNVNKQLADLE